MHRYVVCPDMMIDTVMHTQVKFVMEYDDRKAEKTAGWPCWWFCRVHFLTDKQGDGFQLTKILCWARSVSYHLGDREWTSPSQHQSELSIPISTWQFGNTQKISPTKVKENGSFGCTPRGASHVPCRARVRIVPLRPADPGILGRFNSGFLHWSWNFQKFCQWASRSSTPHLDQLRIKKCVCVCV